MRGDQPVVQPIFLTGGVLEAVGGRHGAGAFPFFTFFVSGDPAGGIDGDREGGTAVHHVGAGQCLPLAGPFCINDFVVLVVEAEIGQNFRFITLIDRLVVIVGQNQVAQEDALDIRPAVVGCGNLHIHPAIVTSLFNAHQMAGEGVAVISSYRFGLVGCRLLGGIAEVHKAGVATPGFLKPVGRNKGQCNGFFSAQLILHRRGNLIQRLDVF